MHDSPTEMYINVLTLRNIGAWIFSRAMQCKHKFLCVFVHVCLIHL